MPILVTPGWTMAARLSRSISNTRFILETPITTASSRGKAPPASDVPAPRATTLTPWSWQKRKTRLVSSVVVGNTTAIGICR